MDEIIEAILNDAMEKSEGFSFTDQSFIFSELSERFSGQFARCTDGRVWT